MGTDETTWIMERNGHRILLSGHVTRTKLIVAIGHQLIDVGLEKKDGTSGIIHHHVITQARLSRHDHSMRTEVEINSSN